MKDIVKSLPKEKVKEDSLWLRLALRPVSFPLAWLALRMKLSACFVSYFSAIVSISAGVLFSWNPEVNPVFAGIGAVLFNVFAVLDCVDGNMARVTKKAGPWGGWADAVMGFIAYTSVFFATGMYVFWKTQWWPVLLIVGLTSSANLLTRVAYQIYKNIVGESAHKSVSFERMLASNVGITGLLMPLVLVFHFCGFLPGMWFIIWFNAAFYGAGCTVTVFKLAIKAAKGAA
jgi:phosphatidylglycerophosphate synthase